MEKNYNIEVVNAWYVTKDTITPCTAFKMLKKQYSSETEVIWYRVDGPWNETYSNSYYREVAWTEQEAQEMKKTKMQEHLEYLKKEQERNKQTIEAMEKELAQ